MIKVMDNAISQMYKVVNDFLKDLIIPFPEYELLIKKWWDFDRMDEEKVKNIYKHFQKIFPECFMDIINQNESIFKEDSLSNTEFLPNINFKYLWKCDISDITRKTIWKYLQLIVYTIITNAKGEDTNISNIIKDLDVEDIQGKIMDTIKEMETMFKKDKTEENTTSNTFEESMSNMLNSSLGSLAKEIADETIKDIHIDANNPMEIFQQMFKDPSKITNMIKKVSEKLDSKIKTGDLDEKDLLSESVDMFGKMKDIPEFSNFQNIFENLTKMGNINPKNLNKNAMEEKYKKMEKKEKLKQRLLKKKKEKEESKKVEKPVDSIDSLMNDEEIIKLFNEK